MDTLKKEARQARKKVLVIDGDKLANDRMCESLTESGFEPLPAHTWQRARGHIVTKRPDAIIMNFAFTDSRSREQFRHISHHELSRDIPLLLVSKELEGRVDVTCFMAGIKKLSSRSTDLDDLPKQLQFTLSENFRLPSLGELLER